MNTPPNATVPEPVAEPLVVPEDAQLSLKIRTLDQKTYPITICAAASVPQLKEVVAVETGVTLARQRLIYRGRVLKNDQTLAAYSLENGHVLHLVVRAVPLTDTDGQASATATSASDRVAEQDALIVAPSLDNNTAEEGTSMNALNAQIDQFQRSSLRLRSVPHTRTHSPPSLSRNNDEPDPTMGRSGRGGLPGHVLLGATISVPEGAEVTMPFLNSMIANLMTQVNEGGAETNRDERTETATSTHRTILSREAMGNSTAAEMQAATARALRRHQRNRDGSGRSRGRRSLSSAERQFSLRARMGLRLQSVRDTLDDASLEFPAELTALPQGDSNTALSEVQQQVEMLLTLVHRFGPRLRLLAAALAQRDRMGGAAMVAPDSFSSTELAAPPAESTNNSVASMSTPAAIALNASDTDATTIEPLISSRHVIRTIEVLTSIGESIELLASMARHAFVRQSVQAGELSRRFSVSANDSTRATFDREASSSTDAIVQAPGNGLQESTRASRASARSAVTSLRPRLRFRVNTTDMRSDQDLATTTATGGISVATTGSTFDHPVNLTSTASAGAPLAIESGTPIYSDAHGRRSDGGRNESTALLSPASVSISGMRFPVLSSVVFPFSLAAGLGGSHATTSWNLADFVSRITSELPISTLYGVLAGDATHLHHILAHIGFALFSGVDVPRVIRPSIHTWAQDFENELRRLLRSHALPPGVINQVAGSEDRGMALGDELLRVLEPFIADLVDLLVRATSASRAAAFGTSSAAFLRTMAQQIVRQLRAYARGDSTENEEESDERLKRLLLELLTWLGLNEYVASFAVNSLLVWTAEVENTRGRGRIREREETDSADVPERPASKQRRE
ncbi:putative Ubiquitin domain-containing protein [Plasmopara halstedii]